MFVSFSNGTSECIRHANGLWFETDKIRIFEPIQMGTLVKVAGRKLFYTVVTGSLGWEIGVPEMPKEAEHGDIIVVNATVVLVVVVVILFLNKC